MRSPGRDGRATIANAKPARTGPGRAELAASKDRERGAVRSSAMEAHACCRLILAGRYQAQPHMAVPASLRPPAATWPRTLQARPSVWRSGEFHNQPLATAAIARIITATSTLCKHRIVYAPIAGHPPGLHGIEMNGAGGFWRFLAVDAPVIIQLRSRRLNFTPFIRATRQEHRLFPVPSPVKSEPGMCLRMHRRLERRFLPARPAVGGYIDLTDLAPTGPSQASNLDISPTGYCQST